MVRPKKHLGQHFLRDENIARKIAALVNPAIPLVLEVGPGTGVLTKYLLADERLQAWFIEVDRESAAFLRHTYASMQERLIETDFLEYDLTGFPPRSQPAGESALPQTVGGSAATAAPAITPGSFMVIGNFPYNISSQILFRVLDHRDRIPEVVGMFQKEVAERIAARPGNRSYGILSVLLQAWYDIEYLFTVSESVFYPPPKVKSAVIRLRRNGVNDLGCDESLFRKVVKTAFNQRRKTLRNALKPLTGDTSGLGEWYLHPGLHDEASNETSGKAVIPRTTKGKGLMDQRAEQLSVGDFIRLATEISTFAKI